MSSPDYQNNMLHPQAGYFPPVRPEQRRHSSSYTDRYRPRGYSNPPPNQADPGFLHPAQVPLPMSGPPTPFQPPYPTEHTSQTRLDMPLVPARQLADEIPMRRSAEIVYPDGLRRPSYDAQQMRRMSHDSRRSHRSDRSHHSHHSHRPRYEEDEDNDDNDDYERHEHHHHHHQHEEDIQEYRRRQKAKGENVSRSFGGSLLSVFSPLKYLLEPRDKD